MNILPLFDANWDRYQLLIICHDLPASGSVVHWLVFHPSTLPYWVKYWKFLTKYFIKTTTSTDVTDNTDITDNTDSADNTDVNDNTDGTINTDSTINTDVTANTDGTAA